MTCLPNLSYERRVCRWSVFTAVCLHLGIVTFLFLAGTAQPEIRYQPLGVMEFAHFDPEGGKPGGGYEDEIGAVPEQAAEPEQASPPEEPEPVVKPEPEELEPEPVVKSEPAELEPEPQPQVIESVSEKAVPIPSPPLPEKLKEQPKSVPKPTPEPKPEPKATVDQASGGSPMKTGQQQFGGSAPGGGPGIGQGGSGGGTGQGNPNAFKAYTSAIQKKLNRYKKYPPGARSARLEGVITVNFTVNRQGNVSGVRIVKSSGHQELDEEVMALLRRVSPFASMPKEMTQTSINLTVPIQFSLR